MRRVERNGLEWLESDLLEGVGHGIFTRRGGVSQGPYESLDVAAKNGAELAQNLARIQEVLGCGAIRQVEQVHGCDLVRVSDPHAPLPPCDALVTNVPGIPLMIKHADCQAAIFYDPVAVALAVVHCGWRGSVANIYGKVVDFFQESFGSRPEELRVVISPSLGPTAAQFLHYQTELPASFWPFQTEPFCFDFWALSQRQLLDKGVEAANIEIASICTYQASADFFSYRREKITGRNGTIAYLRTGSKREAS